MLILKGDLIHCDVHIRAHRSIRSKSTCELLLLPRESHVDESKVLAVKTVRRKQQENKRKAIGTPECCLGIARILGSRGNARARARAVVSWFSLPTRLAATRPGSVVALSLFGEKQRRPKGSPNSVNSAKAVARGFFFLFCRSSCVVHVAGGDEQSGAILQIAVARKKDDD